MDHRYYYVFGQPVDPEALGVPTYFEIIKNPMDFGTIREKLEQGKYSEPQELLEDAQQVFINCFTFNLSDDMVYHMGRELEAEFNKLCAAKGVKGVGITNVDKDSEINDDQPPVEEQPLSMPTEQLPTEQPIMGQPPIMGQSSMDPQPSMEQTLLDSAAAAPAPTAEDMYALPLGETLGENLYDYMSAPLMSGQKRTFDDFNDGYGLVSKWIPSLRTFVHCN